jgi:hypothetical protein
MHALQLLRVEEALEGSAKRVDAVEGGWLARDNVVSFGTQCAQLPAERVGLGSMVLVWFSVSFGFQMKGKGLGRMARARYVQS